MAKKSETETEQKERKVAQKERKVRGFTLQPSENLVLMTHPSRGVTWPKYLYTLGLYGIWRKRHTFALTDRRILVSKGIFDRSERSIPLTRVDDASYNRRWFAGYCDLIVGNRGSRRSERLGPLSGSAAKRLTWEVQSRS
jgi:hypothetical protein